jgi:hypothetical protein
MQLPDLMAFLVVLFDVEYNRESQPNLSPQVFSLSGSEIDQWAIFNCCNPRSLLLNVALLIVWPFSSPKN